MHNLSNLIKSFNNITPIKNNSLKYHTGNKFAVCNVSRSKSHEILRF